MVGLVGIAEKLEIREVFRRDEVNNTEAEATWTGERRNGTAAACVSYAYHEFCFPYVPPIFLLAPPRVFRGCRCGHSHLIEGQRAKAVTDSGVRGLRE